jgi:hypothetical protein
MQFRKGLWLHESHLSCISVTYNVTQWCGPILPGAMVKSPTNTRLSLMICDCCRRDIGHVQQAMPYHRHVIQIYIQISYQKGRRQQQLQIWFNLSSTGLQK